MLCDVILIGKCLFFQAQVTLPKRRFQPVLESLEDRLVPSTVYLQNNLVSDIPGVATFTDPNLVNPWGIVASPNGPFWISDNGTGFSTLYDGNGNSLPAASPLVVTIPLPPGSTAPNASPTGIVFNTTSDFTVSSGNTSGPAVFIFAAEDGAISGVESLRQYHKCHFGSGQEQCSRRQRRPYKGLALGSNASGNFIYATNFRAGATGAIASTNFFRSLGSRCSIHGSSQRYRA